MKTRTETRVIREGENLGPIDWEYDFRSHFNNLCTSDEGRDAACERAVARLREVVDGGDWEATTDGGWPRMWWHRVLEIGMYDGWPYWRPVPSVLLKGTLGAEWHSFNSISEFRKVEAPVNG